MEDNKVRYRAVCSECSHVFYACKSLAQEFGRLDLGCGSCPQCKTFLNLTYDTKNNEMKTMEWNKYLMG